MSIRSLCFALILGLLPASLLLSTAGAEAAEPLPRTATGRTYASAANRLPTDISIYLRKSPLELDVFDNDAYYGTTKEVLSEQIRSGFSDFDHAGRTKPGWNSPPTSIGGINLAGGPLRLVHVEVEDPYSGDPSRQTCPLTGSCELPLDYNVSTPAVKLVWSFDSASIKNRFLEYINETGKRALRVTLSGEQLKRRAVTGIGTKNFDYLAYYGTGKHCISSMSQGCLVMVVVRDAWFDGSAPWSDWNVRVEGVREGLTRYGTLAFVEQKAQRTVTPQARVKDFFVATLGKTTMSSRCTTCHDMDTPERISNRHGFDVATEMAPSIVNDDEEVHHGGSCQGCHGSAMPEDFHETRWATPTVPQDIRWSQIINQNLSSWPKEICNRMVDNLETAAARKEHFHEDARLFWAVTDGTTPNGDELTTAHPNDYNLFIQRFDAWNEAGAPCPN